MVTEKVCSVVGWTLLCVVVYASLYPLNHRPVLATSTSLEHTAAYAAIGLFLCRAYPRHFALMVLVVIGSAAILELLQLLTPDRHARWIDALDKMCGGGIGLIVGRATLQFERALRRKI